MSWRGHHQNRDACVPPSSPSIPHRGARPPSKKLVLERGLATYLPSFQSSYLRVLTVVLPFGTLMGPWISSTTERYREQRVWLKKNPQNLRNNQEPRLSWFASHLQCETTPSRLGEVAILSNVQNQKREWGQINQQRTMFQKKKIN